MKVSFIIPTYKKNPYLLESINSVNSLLGDFEKEIIVVHNGDESEYYSYLDKLPLLIENLLVYTIVEKGVSRARNLGIEKSTGDYLVFLDDDDLLSSNFISDTLLLKLVRNEKELIITNLRTFVDDVRNVEKLKIDYIGEGITVLNKREGRDAFYFRKLLSSACFKIYPRNLIGNVRFNVNLSVSEDALFVFELSKNIEKYFVFKDVLYYRRVRQESVSNTKKRFNEYLSVFLKFSSSISKIYFYDIKSYSFLFYGNRLMASFKFFIKNVLK